MTPSLPEKPPTSSNPAAVQPAEEFIPLEGEVNQPESKSSPNEDGPASASTAAPQADRQPPLPTEEPPPLPNEPIPDQQTDDGWEPVWDENAQAFYFYNSKTQATQWENPRIPEALTSTSSTHQVSSNTIDAGPPGADTNVASTLPAKPPPSAGGYDPSIHGDYDPTASYAQAYALSPAAPTTDATDADPSTPYAATGAFNRFTGKWQASDINPERFNDENKSKRQMNAYFDVDAAANTHDGRSLKAERSGKKLSKKELKAFKEKRREKKEEKRRAWLRD